MVEVRYFLPPSPPNLHKPDTRLVGCYAVAARWQSELKGRGVRSCIKCKDAGVVWQIFAPCASL